MHIHTFCDGETLASVAEKYGISERTLRVSNALDEKQAAIGSELLILTPTRTYTVKRGDTAERLILRFGINRRELYAQNPTLWERGLVPGDEIALKYDGATYGTGVANGYFYKGCSLSALKRALPYLTYVTFASAIEDSGEIYKHFDDTEAKLIAIENEKIPLLRIYRKNSSLPYGEAMHKLCDAMISTALDGNYRGIVLSECAGEGYDEFLVKLRGKMIGCDLILISEISEDSSVAQNEYCDGSILSYDKYSLSAVPSFDEGEKRIYSDFACMAESSKTFIALPSMAKWGRGYCSVCDALSTALQYGCKIETDDQTLISSFYSDRRGEFRFTSLKNIKATLDLIFEYGFMGISFDIMRVPTPYLMMYNHLFRTAHVTTARAVEGCSRRP
jgi:hypothetical protein